MGAGIVLKVCLTLVRVAYVPSVVEAEQRSKVS